MAVSTHPSSKPDAADDFTRNRRRRQLIDATIRTIAGHGLSRVTLAKVADAANMSPGIVNFYFKSKEQLLLETLSELQQEYETKVKRAIASADGPAQTLLLLIDAHFDPAGAKRLTTWSGNCVAFVEKSR